MPSRLSLDKKTQRKLFFPVLFLLIGLVLTLIYHTVFESRPAGIDGVLFYLSLSLVSFTLVILFQRFVDNKTLYVMMSLGWGLVFIGALEKLNSSMLHTPDYENENLFSIVIFSGLVLIAFGLYLWAREVYLQEKVREQQNRVISLSTNLMSHDAGNDLQAVLGYIEAALIECEDYGERPRRMLEAARVATVRITHLLQSFKTNTITENMPLGPLIDQVVAQAKKAYPELEITTNIDRKTENLIIAGGPLLQMALTNLIRNSAIHNGSNPIMNITIKRESNKVIIVASDDGPGIPEELRDQIFLRGKKIEGHGIGIYLTRQIVVACDGVIELLESERGATFRIELPLTS